MTPLSTPSGFTISTEDIDSAGNVVSADKSTKITFTNDEPSTTDANAMEISGNIVTSQTTMPEDITITVTVYPEDGSSPLTVSPSSVSINNVALQLYLT